jgi:predicted glycogen debranching enzyme
MRQPVTLGREVCGDLGQALRREWLVTNGIGGYGAGTVAGCQTRRYHGLLVTAEKPPAGRTLRLVDLDVVISVGGHREELGCHEYADGTVHPTGHRLIESFALDGTVPTWTYAIGAARLTKRVYMGRGRNTTYVTYTLERSLQPVTIELRPLCSGRDYHWHRRGEHGYRTELLDRGCRTFATEPGPGLTLTADAGKFDAAPHTHWNMHHRAEVVRGLDSDEDLHVPGVFTATVEAGATLAITATIEDVATPAGVALTELRQHEAGLLEGVAVGQPPWIRQLLLAADQFIVSRFDVPAARRPGAAAGATIIAGYPWFGDWGRDTMIALPGLTLATGRAELAAEILRTFARYLDQGLLPNRFPDAGEAPEYNTVDATLWYFVALHDYLRVTDDTELARELYPALVEIIAWHRRGTRHGIALDPVDGLLRAGEPGVQLTWMDAKVGGWVVTPRSGKAVEINALWCNAQMILGEIAGRLGDRRVAREATAQARRSTGSFAAKFWNSDAGYLYDVIEGPDDAGPDRSLRPNQLLALALPHTVIDRARAASVLAACERELLTSYGLRTLSPGNPGYAARYSGDQRQRDGAYHQGTVWPWLVGAFARAHFSIHGDPAAAAAYLAPFEQHLADACIGQISEIFDAEAPHAPQGCFAQAWSVAEVLRAWLNLQAAAVAVPQPAIGSARGLKRAAANRKAS